MIHIRIINKIKESIKSGLDKITQAPIPINRQIRIFPDKKHPKAIPARAAAFPPLLVLSNNIIIEIKAHNLRYLLRLRSRLLFINSPKQYDVHMAATELAGK